MFGFCGGREAGLAWGGDEKIVDPQSWYSIGSKGKTMQIDLLLPNKETEISFVLYVYQTSTKLAMKLASEGTLDTNLDTKVVRKSVLPHIYSLTFLIGKFKNQGDQKVLFLTFLHVLLTQTHQYSPIKNKERKKEQRKRKSPPGHFNS